MRLISLAFIFATAFAHAADKPSSTAADRDDYPLKTCVVSNETLSADFITYTHKEPGKPDVTFRLCCESCIEELRQDPPKFLKKLEAAKSAAANRSSAPPAKKKS